MNSLELEYLGSCPVCDGNVRVLLYSGLNDITFNCGEDLWDLYRCEGCHSAYIDPRPNTLSIGKAYINYYTHKSIEKKGLFNKIRQNIINGYANKAYGTKYYNAWKIGYLIATILSGKKEIVDAGYRHIENGKGRKLLDVGCGNGDFLIKAKNAGWNVLGVDPDEKAVAAALKNKVDARIGTLGDLDSNDKFSVITASHVLEHVHEPRAFLKECLDHLLDGGYLWLDTPNIDANGFDLYGYHWRGLEIPRHLVLFNEDSLSYLLKEVGFSRVEIMPYRELCKDVFYNSELLKNGGNMIVAERRRIKIEHNHCLYGEIARENSKKREFLTIKAFK